MVGVAQLPGVAQLLQQVQRGFAYTPGVLGVDVEASAQRGDGALADVFVVGAPDHLVDQSLAQGLVRDPHVRDGKALNNERKHRDAAGEDRAALVAQAFEVDGGRVAEFDQRLAQPGQCIALMPSSLQPSR
jgi:hypothetical protein